MANLSIVLRENENFENFLKTQRTRSNLRKIPLLDLKKFILKVDTWNAGNPSNLIVKIAIYNTLNGRKVSSYLVGLNQNDDVVIGGGGNGDGPPHYR